MDSAFMDGNVKSPGKETPYLGLSTLFNYPLAPGCARCIPSQGLCPVKIKRISLLFLF